MGQSRSRRPRKAGVSRRDFLRRAGAGTMAVTALPLLPGCSDGIGVSGGGSSTVTAVRFDHSVASGDPLSDRVILWTRVTPTTGTGAINGSYVVATDPALSSIVQQGTFSTDASRDYTVKIDRTGLLPDTTYYYRFSALGVNSPIGRTKTLPVGAVDRLRMAVVSCSSLAHGFFNAYGRIAARADLDLVVHLGDYIYEYASDPAGGPIYGTARAYEPVNEIRSLSDYRIRHAQYKREPELQAVHRQHPMVVIWDDHETANDAWQGGAENHNNDPAMPEGDWNQRVDRALQAYYEWMPLRPTGPGNPRSNFRSFQYGELAELVMLEERLSARSQQLPANSGATFRQTGDFTDPARVLIGTEQENFLFDRMRNTPAQWKLIGQGVMFAQLKLVGAPNALGLSQHLNADQWDGYEPARNRIYNVLRGDTANPAVNDVVFLTGDIHTSWAADLTPDPNNILVANGGYLGLLGAGSLAVEFVTTSVTSPGLEQLNPVADVLRLNNPHFKYIDLARKGYLLLDVTAERVSGEWWYVDTIDTRSDGESYGTAFETRAGENRMRVGSQSQPRANPPAPAP